MNDQPKHDHKDQKKQQVANQTTKKNTDIWKQKQAQKKKQKPQNQSKNHQLEIKQDKKQDKKQKKKQKKNKQQDKDKDKTQQPNKNIKNKSKPQQQTNKSQPTKQKQPPQLLPPLKKLQTIQTLLIPNYPKLLKNRSAQIQLIQKQIHNLIRPQNTILYLGKLQLNNSALTAGSGKNNYQLVQIQGYSNFSQSQIICRYEDLSYLMIQQIDKVFLQAIIIFQNGSALLPKGYQNIAILANHYNKPLVIASGSWNYCRISITSYDQLQHLFGSDLLLKYDWISSDCITQVCMEFGSALPSQISYQVEQGYKNYGFSHAKW